MFVLSHCPREMGKPRYRDVKQKASTWSADKCGCILFGHGRHLCAASPEPVSPKPPAAVRNHDQSVATSFPFKRRSFMNRRTFLHSTGAVCAGWALAKSIPVFADSSQTGGGWRTFEVTTRVEVLKPNGVTHIWLPSTLIRDTPFQRTHASKFSAEGGTAGRTMTWTPLLQSSWRYGR